MAPEHDPEQLLEAASLLPDGSIVALTGNGPLRGALAARAETASNTLITDPLEADEQALALVAADVLLLSEPTVSRRLSLPIELARCLSAGRPVVATASVSGTVTAELAHAAGAGLVVPPCEPARLAGALLALHADPSRCVAMGLAAIAYAEARLSREAVLTGFDLVVDAALAR
jgi:glycosyltransferase involved in cell wall biosynthesis